MSKLLRKGVELTGQMKNVGRNHRSASKPSFSNLAQWRNIKGVDKDENTQRFKYFLVLDFEATCEKNVTIKSQEIIEFPCLKVNGSTYEVEAVFHKYVKPMKNPVLTPFCIDLTGILQEMVDDEEYFPSVLTQFEQWMIDNDVGNDQSIFVTCGDWDLKVMLPAQCQLSEVQIPPSMRSWINIKTAFRHHTGHSPRGIQDMLRRFDLPHLGRLHSGIDDCRNITAILQALGKNRHLFKQTGELKLES